jgi:hypothetical protein
LRMSRLSARCALCCLAFGKQRIIVKKGYCGVCLLRDKGEGYERV